MALPSVSFTIVNGTLGRSAKLLDRVAGITLTGIATSGLALGVAAEVTSLKDFEALGFASDYDTSNNVYAWGHVRDFYSLAPIGTPLWVMLTSDATTMAQAADKANAYARALRDAAQGAITVMGITRRPPNAYAPTITAGIDPDALAAVIKPHEMAEEAADLNIPFRGIVEGRAFNGNYAALSDLRGNTNNRVAVTLANDQGGSYASVGLLLGWICRLQVHRNIGRVLEGAVPVLDAYLSSNVKVKTVSIGNLTILHNKGYIFFKKHLGRNGFFYNDDPTASPTTDDYAQLAEGFLIDKAQRVVYTAYIIRLLDNIQVDPDTGLLDASIVAMIEDELTEALESALLGSRPQASGVTVVIDPAQNVLSTSKVVASIRVVPQGTLRELEVEIGLNNPLKNNN